MDHMQKRQRNVLANIANRMRFRRYRPVVRVTPSTNLIKLGSNYGGWAFEPSDDLEGSTAISCGLGEDASFDVEFARKFNAKVLIVDPTPRAVQHFSAIQERLGQPATQSYSEGGKQPAHSYDLRNLTKDSLMLEPSALWVENATVKFFAPRNSTHV